MFSYNADKTREWLMATWLARTLPWRFFALSGYALIPTGFIGMIAAAAQQGSASTIISSLMFFVGMLCGVIAINKYEPDEK